MFAPCQSRLPIERHRARAGGRLRLAMLGASSPYFLTVKLYTGNPTQKPSPGQKKFGALYRPAVLQIPHRPVDPTNPASHAPPTTPAQAHSSPAQQPRRLLLLSHLKNRRPIWRPIWTDLVDRFGTACPVPMRVPEKTLSTPEDRRIWRRFTTLFAAQTPNSQSPYGTQSLPHAASTRINLSTRGSRLRPIPGKISAKIPVGRVRLLLPAHGCGSTAVPTAASAQFLRLTPVCVPPPWLRRSGAARQHEFRATLSACLRTSP